MTSVRDEITQAALRLGLPAERVREVPEAEAHALFDRFLARFTGGRDVRWWWEWFTLPQTTRKFDDAGFRHLKEIIPDPHERLWFVVEDDQLPFYPVYETTVADAEAVIGESYGFEYYLIPKDLAWIICESHHNIIIAAGSPVDQRLRELTGKRCSALGQPER